MAILAKLAPRQRVYDMSLFSQRQAVPTKELVLIEISMLVVLTRKLLCDPSTIRWTMLSLKAAEPGMLSS